MTWYNPKNWGNVFNQIPKPEGWWKYMAVAAVVIAVVNVDLVSSALTKPELPTVIDIVRSYQGRQAGCDNNTQCEPEYGESASNCPRDCLLTATPTPTSTPWPTATPTPTATSSPTPTPTATCTSTPTPTPTATWTPTPTPTPTLTPTPTRRKVCNPGQWTSCGGTHGARCEEEHVRMCQDDGTWGPCLWDPKACGYIPPTPEPCRCVGGVCVCP